MHMQHAHMVSTLFFSLSLLFFAPPVWLLWGRLRSLRQSPLGSVHRSQALGFPIPDSWDFGTAGLGDCCCLFLLFLGGVGDCFFGDVG